MDSEPEEGELLEEVSAIKKPKATENLPHNMKSPYLQKSISNQSKLPKANQSANLHLQNPQKPAGFWPHTKQSQNKHQNSALKISKPSSQQTKTISQGQSLHFSLPPQSCSPNHTHLNKSNITLSSRSTITPTPSNFSTKIPTISNAPSQINRKKTVQEPFSTKSKESSSLITLPQKRQKEFEPKLQCKFWENGACSKGSSCTFAHIGEIKVKNELCKYFMTGCCTKAELCGYSHDFSKFPCKFFHGVGVCSSGEICKFSHERLKNNEIFEFMKTHESYLKQVQELKGDTNLGEYFCLYLKSKVN